MTFTSVTFVAFLAIVFSLYWIFRSRVLQNLLLVIASYAFYAWWDYRFCALMAAASLIDFGVGLGLNTATHPARRKALLWTAIVANLAMLGFFKYFNFFAENFQALATSIGWQVDSVTLRVILPVGISFYTFQTMSYSIDVYRGQMKASTRILDYLAYVSFFPQLVAGPIERAINLLPQFHEKRSFHYAQAADGCRQMLWGFFKKMVVADNVAPFVDRVFANPSSSSAPELVLGTVFFAIQIYCDFSAYSDIAVGTARLFGIRLMRNFAYPYFSESMGEFWRRWHISLSSWFKDYVYFPLGGSRAGSAVRRTANVMATFLLSGFWHGASWNFLWWGAINGAAVLPETLAREKARTRAADLPMPGGLRPRTMFRVALTFAVVCLGWVFFRADTVTDAFLIVKRICVESFVPSTYSQFTLAGKLDPLGGKFLFLSIGVLFGAEWLQRRHPHALRVEHWPSPARWILYTGLFWIILAWGTFSQCSFIYFQF